MSHLSNISSSRRIVADERPPAHVRDHGPGRTAVLQRGTRSHEDRDRHSFDSGLSPLGDTGAAPRIQRIERTLPRLRAQLRQGKAAHPQRYKNMK